MTIFPSLLDQGSLNVRRLRLGTACWSLSLRPLPFCSQSFSLFLHIHHWFLCFSTMLLVVFISGLTPFWVQWFLLKPLFLFQLLKSAYLTTNLSSVLSSSEEERAFLFVIRSSCPIIHASIHLFTQGQHPSWVFSASHISLCLVFHSNHRVLFLLCNKPSFPVHSLNWVTKVPCLENIARGPWDQTVSDPIGNSWS